MPTFAVCAKGFSARSCEVYPGYQTPDGFFNPLDPAKTPVLQDRRKVRHQVPPPGLMGISREKGPAGQPRRG